MNREELLRLYAGGEKDFTEQGFGGMRDQNIRGGIYRETNFSEEEFDGAAFREVDLSFTNFRSIRMFESSFMNCYMEGVDFSLAYFGQVLFVKVDLTKSIFRNTTMSETGFSHVNLSFADFRGVKRFNEVTFDNVIFHETIMPDGSIRTGNT